MSKLIKASRANRLEREKVTISVQQIHSQPEELEDSAQERQHSETVAPSLAEASKQIEIERSERLQQAQEEAEQIRQQAEEELENARQQIAFEEADSKQRIEEAFATAKQEGYEEGFNKGETAGEKSYKKKIKEAQKIIASAREDYQTHLHEAEPVIIDLAHAVAKRVLGEALEQDEGIWKNIVKEAIQEVREHEEVKLFVAPAHYETTLKQKEELKALLSYSQDLLIYPDAQLEADGCVVETSYGRIEASVDSQLEEIKAQLHTSLKENSHESR
ncbi:flagellar assembly protein FliH [Salsuginibacillus kocurii]|uniref:flagellar assembly protein FliH n=1 Tax=Salsuginibacillus kocurii TaxID=427078 RepID=UPI00037B8B68|nr:flagellar assembly protein FliH [Salsuginibacillus kocurii]